MNIFAIIFAAALSVSATFAHSAGQYLDDEPVGVQASSPIANTNVESAVSSSTTIEAVSTVAPTVNAAEIGRAINTTLVSAEINSQELEQKKQVEDFISLLPKVFGMVVLLIILSTLPSLFGKGVFFWDITDVVVSTLLSLLVAASFIALVVVYLDKTMTDDVHSMFKTIFMVSLISAYILNFVKAKIHNSSLLAPLIAFGRLFLPLLILFAVFIARWHGSGRISYQQQDHESLAEYEGRIKSQEHDLAERRRQSSWWIALIAIFSIWLYSKLIAQKEWKGFAGYFGKVI